MRKGHDSDVWFCSIVGHIGSNWGKSKYEISYQNLVHFGSVSYSVMKRDEPKSWILNKRTNYQICGLPIIQCVPTRLVENIEPIVSCCVPYSTNRDGVHTPDSLVHTVLLGIH